MRILVTGGPVYAHLDPVKIITNRFKGGMMATIADILSLQGCVVDYLTTEGSVYPRERNVKIIVHKGIEDYREQVLKLAPEMNGVVLGAAVANLIPLEPMTTKFPSHNYKPGDVIPIDFTIAPRIIDEVKKVAPKTKLFGFKLLTNVPEQELINAAYQVLLEAKATAMFANDTKNLLRKLIVTRERGVIEADLAQTAKFIQEACEDRYYSTVFLGDSDHRLPIKQVAKFDDLVVANQHHFEKTPEGYMFGTIAVVDSSGGFLTTGRGKNELDDRVYVASVDHLNRVVYVPGDRKATLNAPLLDILFKLTKCSAIVHYHKTIPGYPFFKYAPSGTVRDVERVTNLNTLHWLDMSVFNIVGHGCYKLYKD